MISRLRWTGRGIFGALGIFLKPTRRRPDLAAIGGVVVSDLRGRTLEAINDFSSWAKCYDGVDRYARKTSLQSQIDSLIVGGSR